MLFRSEVIALYRAADVMLVTPTRDGMNLVAKEFAAARTDGDGVLVLSEFAGAADEMFEALQVNPVDVDGMAAAIEQALDMPEAERRSRMAGLRSRVQALDVHRWADGFLAAVKSLTNGRGVDVVLDPVGGDRFTDSLRSLAPEGRLLVVGFTGPRRCDGRRSDALVYGSSRQRVRARVAG